MLPALTLTLAAAAPRAGDAFVEAELASGVRLFVLEVKDAPRQTFFALLPLGLAHDDAGRAQWSHLLEHLLIRTSDPEGFADGSITFNGETTDGALRLDVHAPPEQAPRAAAKLLAWLAADAFDADVLAREKRSVALEVENTAPRGFTHKWATAAWAQVVRHGATEAAVLGDVEAATVAELEAYADSKLALGPRVRIVAVGPLPPGEAARLFDAPPSAARVPPAATGRGDPPPSAAPAADRTAAWDLPATHFLEWYLLPDATPVDRTAAMLLANLLAIKLQGDGELAQARIVALAGADVVLPGGRVLCLSASLPDASGRELAARAFRRAIDGLERVPQIGTLDAYLVMARNEAAGLPDFAAVRRQWAGRPHAELIEAQLGLALALREWSTGLAFAEIGAATRALTREELEGRRDRHLAAPLASRLLLTPRR